MIDSNNLKNVFLPPLRSEFHRLLSGGTAGQAIQKVIDCYRFKTVLDVGCGEGLHSQIFKEHGKNVVSVDLGDSVYSRKSAEGFSYIKGDFLSMEFEEEFDCVWCAHVLEHQPNINEFLVKIHRVTKEGGVVCITVPPAKNEIVGGHLTVWNAGLLIYNLVLAGFDCKNIAILRYGYNISAIVTKQTADLSKITLQYDAGDVERLARFFPEGLREGFNGDIYELNWIRFPGSIQ